MAFAIAMRRGAPRSHDFSETPHGDSQRSGESYIPCMYMCIRVSIKDAADIAVCLVVNRHAACLGRARLGCCPRRRSGGAGRARSGACDVGSARPSAEKCAESEDTGDGGRGDNRVLHWGAQKFRDASQMQVGAWHR